MPRPRRGARALIARAETHSRPRLWQGEKRLPAVSSSVRSEDAARNGPFLSRDALLSSVTLFKPRTRLRRFRFLTTASRTPRLRQPRDGLSSSGAGDLSPRWCPLPGRSAGRSCSRPCDQPRRRPGRASSRCRGRGPAGVSLGRGRRGPHRPASGRAARPVAQAAPSSRCRSAVLPAARPAPLPRLPPPRALSTGLPSGSGRLSAGLYSWLLRAWGGGSYVTT